MPGKIRAAVENDLICIRWNKNEWTTIKKCQWQLSTIKHFSTVSWLEFIVKLEIKSDGSQVEPRTLEAKSPKRVNRVQLKSENKIEFDMLIYPCCLDQLEFNYRGHLDDWCGCCCCDRWKDIQGTLERTNQRSRAKCERQFNWTFNGKRREQLTQASNSKVQQIEHQKDEDHLDTIKRINKKDNEQINTRHE